jgi:hypothetical protein
MSIEEVREDAPERLQSTLQDLPGVGSVDLSGYPDRVVVRFEGAGIREFVAESVRETIAAEVGVTPQVEVELQVPPTVRTHRARFESVEVRPTEPGRIRARVALEWQDERVVGEAEGESNPAGELRICAMATIRAVEKVAAGEVSFTLIGAKELHVFDHDLVAVLLHAPQLPASRLLGTSIIAEDRRRSAALAVLSATNRVVGSFVDPEG